MNIRRLAHPSASVSNRAALSVLVALVLSLLPGGPAVRAVEPPAYELVDLGTLGGRASGAYDFNEQGQIVGYSQTASGETPAFLCQDGHMAGLCTL